MGRLIPYRLAARMMGISILELLDARERGLVVFRNQDGSEAAGIAFEEFRNAVETRWKDGAPATDADPEGRSGPSPQDRTDLSTTDDGYSLYIDEGNINDYLKVFWTAASGGQDSGGLPSLLRVKRTLLVLVAALLDSGDIDPASPDAVDHLVRLTEAIGAPLSRDTVKSYLAEIPDALSGRSS